MHKTIAAKRRLLITEFRGFDMTKHLFLTGEKGIGKSSLIKVLLKRSPGPFGGFFTVKSAGVLSGQITVHLLRVGMRDSPCADNLLFCCGAQEDQASIAARFNALGCAALTPRPGVRLLVMDEIGPHEEEAVDFRQAVLAALNGPVQILGVLQRAESCFLHQIETHPNVRLITVTAANRDVLASAL